MSQATSRLNPRAVCITKNVALRKTLRRTLNAAGSTVEFRDDIDEESTLPGLVFVDQDLRRGEGVDELIQIVGERSKVIVLGESLADDDVVAMLRNNPLDHCIADSETADESELVVTSVKLLSGDIFGLEKYLAWGAKIHSRAISTYEEKRSALFAVAAHATEVGTRRPMIARIESVTDELLMNALYDAPAVAHGAERGQRITKSSDPSFVAESPALLRYACDGRYLAISVQDNYGELRKEAILDHLSRARVERGRPKEADELGSGAGLGLYFILSSVTRFIANVEPKRRTEVICLFDMRQSGRDADTCARSVHIFRT